MHLDGLLLLNTISVPSPLGMQKSEISESANILHLRHTDRNPLNHHLHPKIDTNLNLCKNRNGYIRTLSGNTLVPDTPLVSVIIPTYYRNELLRECLSNVKNQTYDSLEIIVVDDSGEGYASEVVNEFESIEYIRLEKNRGPNEARGIGIEHSSGEFVQLLDDDDIILKNKIQDQLELFENRPEVGVVYSGVKTESSGDVYPRSDGRGEVLKLALIFELVACVTSTMLIRTETINPILPLPDPPGSDDTYLIIELAQRCEFDYVEKVLVKKGGPGDQRGDTYGAIEGTWGILQEYEDLYDEFCDDVRQTAVSNAASREARYLVQQHLYSLRAVYLFFLSIRAHPKPDRLRYFQFMAGLLGRPGYKIAQILYNKMD
jgi:glycosyltransferase involved in cell wall biosynthesis